MALFLSAFLSVYGLLNTYVAWRLSRLPWVAAHVPTKVVWLVVAFLAAAFPLSWMARRAPALAQILEVIGTTWMGVFLLLLTCLLVAELATVGGWLFAAQAPHLRQFAVIIAMALSGVAVNQARRPPAVVERDLTLAGLDPASDGFRLVLVSDMHLGTMLGEDFAAGVIRTIDSLKPDAVVIAGDLVDRDANVVEPMVPTLRTLRAPRGVYAVIGNHEYYGGEAKSASVLHDAGYRVLRNESVQVAPGLVIAGIDDLTVNARSGAAALPLLHRALDGRPPGATVLLSHTPAALDEASKLGVQLMLSGHTHDGQIWPFRYLVKTRFPHSYGSKQVGAMTSLITRGVGTWGPRMRLWARGEVVVLRLHAPGKP